MKATLAVPDGKYQNLPVGRMLAGEAVTPLAALTNTELSQSVEKSARKGALRMSTAEAREDEFASGIAAVREGLTNKVVEAEVEVPDDLLVERLRKEQMLKVEAVSVKLSIHGYIWVSIRLRRCINRHLLVCWRWRRACSLSPLVSEA